MTAPQAGDLLRAVQEKQDALPSRLRELAAFCLNKPEQLVRSTNQRLCEVLNVSEPTLVRFCQAFGYKGMAEFRMEWAIAMASMQTAHAGSDAGWRSVINAEGKDLIGREVAKIVESAPSILIDSGTTLEAVARHLSKTDAKTVMTINIDVAKAALDHGVHDVMIAGGKLDPETLSLSGRLIEKTLDSVRFDTFVMGVSSVDPFGGFSTIREEEATRKNLMIKAAQRTIVVADKTKFCSPYVYNVCGFDEVSMLITDAVAGSPELAPFADMGLEIIALGVPEHAAAQYAS